MPCSLRSLAHSAVIFVSSSELGRFHSKLNED
jgi:hypothetical protein